ncbi:RraA family protein [Metapseudomonas otitidis]|uniref:RraA family protein n=1 Tax=Metapseudomonas otitidis TaxID=319939 RepID=UPI003CEA4430
MLEINSKQTWPTGYAIHPCAPSVEARWLEAFANIPSAIVSDCLGRNSGALGLKPFHGEKPLLGTALTVRTRPGDNLMVLKAIQMARPGDVVVIDGSGDTTRAVVGGIMRAMALRAGVVGFAVSGAIRDLAEWRGGELPVFALDNAHRGPSSEGNGEINVPVSCAGMLVTPGDLVIGDADGVVAIPRGELAQVHRRCCQLLDRESAIMASIENDTYDSSRFNTLLQSKGCPV